MRSVESIRIAMDMSKGWILELINDMKDAALTFPTPNGGNHPLWILGHLTYSEPELMREFALGEPNPLADWKEPFGQGSTPVADASQYPSFDELMTKFDEVRAGTLRFLDSLSDDDLNRHSHAPETIRQYFPTIGHCLMAIPLHFMFHGGQVADARRAAGRKPMG